MENPKISIIIPVYNTDQYVRDAIGSIRNQTVKELEILIIDDGSTDNSLTIVTELAKTDERIKVFSQPNQGQAVARNLGLKNARGKYIYFMDSDDLLDASALELCYEKCEHEKLDFVFFDADIFSHQESISFFFDYHRAGHIKDKVYQGQEILSLLLKKGIYRAPVWLYLIRYDYIRQIGLDFYPVRHEDELFTAFAHLKAQRVGYIPASFFKRRLRSNSVMTSSYSNNDIDAYLLIIKKLLKAQNGNSKAVTQRLVRTIINPAIYNAGCLTLSKRLRVLRVCISESYLRYLKLKNITVLLFPFTISLKSYILRKKKLRECPNAHCLISCDTENDEIKTKKKRKLK